MLGCVQVWFGVCWGVFLGCVEVFFPSVAVLEESMNARA